MQWVVPVGFHRVEEAIALNSRLHTIREKVMAKKKGPGIPPNLLIWIEARKRHRLSDAQVQMARELGLNPKKLGGMDNHKQERWKEPLPQYIETLYQKQFRKPIPDHVVSIEQRAEQILAKKQKRKQAKLDAASVEEDIQVQADELESRRADEELDCDVPF